jgi:hypothetical protein
VVCDTPSSDGACLYEVSSTLRLWIVHVFLKNSQINFSGSNVVARTSTHFADGFDL